MPDPAAAAVVVLWEEREGKGQPSLKCEGARANTVHIPRLSVLHFSHDA